MPDRTTARREKAVSKDGAARRWLDFLAEEGYRPRLEAHPEDAGRVAIPFKVEGRQVVLFLSGEDPTYQHLALSYDTEALEAGEAALLEVANELNDGAKVVKVVVDRARQAVSFQVEAFAESLPSRDVLHRWLYALRWTSGAFFDRVRALSRPQALA